MPWRDLGEQAEYETGSSGQRVGHHQIALPPTPEEGDAVRKQAVGRFDQPGKCGHREEACDLRRGIPSVPSA